MQRKLKECQGVRIQSYQHQGGFFEGDNVWFKLLNRNSLFGSATVLYQRGQRDWLQAHGDIKKVAACQVKPFELVDRELLKDESGEYAEKKR